MSLETVLLQTCFDMGSIYSAVRFLLQSYIVRSCTEFISTLFHFCLFWNERKGWIKMDVWRHLCLWVSLCLYMTHFLLTRVDLSTGQYVNWPGTPPRDSWYHVVPLKPSVKCVWRAIIITSAFCSYSSVFMGLAVVLGGLVVIVLVIGPKVRGFIPGRGRWIFKDDKYP
jgi:hypothetical protein